MSNSDLKIEQKGLLNNMSWLGFGNLVIKPIWFVFVTYVCIRQLGFAEYGVMTAVLGLAAILAGIANMGTSPYTIREVSKDLSRARNFLTAFLPFRSLSLIIALGISLAIGFALGHRDEALLALLFAGFYMSFQSLTEYVRAFYRSAENLQWESISMVIEKVLVIALGSAFIFWRPEAWSVLLGMAVGMLLTLLGSTAWLLSRFKMMNLEVGKESQFLRNHLPHAIPLGIAAIFILVYFRTDSVMIESMLGEVESGQYGLAFRFLEAFTLLPAVMVAALLPRFSQLYEKQEKNKLGKLLRQSSLAVFGSAVILAAATSLLADLIVAYLVEGDQARKSSEALRILIWAFPFAALGYILSSVLTAMNDQKRLALVLGVTAILNLIANYLLIPSMGIIGACVATLATQLILSITLFARYRRVINQSD